MKKQIVLLAVAICLFAAAEMQGLVEETSTPSTVSVYVSMPGSHKIVETHWGEGDAACEPLPDASSPLIRTVYDSGGSQFRPTGIEFGGGSIFFADASHSEVGLVGLDGTGFEIISDSSSSTLQNPTDLIFGPDADLLISSRAGSRKSDAGIFRSLLGGDGSYGIPQPYLQFGSGGGSSAEALGMLFERTLLGTESSDAEVLSFRFPYRDEDTGKIFVGPTTLAYDRPLGIAAYGVGRSEVVYVAFSTAGQIKRFKAVYNAAEGAGGDGNPNTFDGLFEADSTDPLYWPTVTLPNHMKPRHLDTDLEGNLYVAASQRSNGENGTLFCIPRDYNREADPPADIGSIQLDSAWGVAVGAGSSVTRDYVPGEGLKLCGDQITIETDEVDEDGAPITVTATLTCTDITEEEFELLLDDDQFDYSDPSDGVSDARCYREPGKSSCTQLQMEITDPVGFTGIVDFSRIFVPFVEFDAGDDGVYGTDDDSVKDPGILYRKTDDPGPVRENILTAIVDAAIDEIDPPRMTGRRDNFGSFMWFCEDCNVEPRIVVPDPLPELEGIVGEPVEVNLDTLGVAVLDFGPLEYEWRLNDSNGPVIGTSEVLTHTFNQAGDYTVILTVTDSGIREKLSSTAEVVEITIGHTVNGVLSSPSKLWPPNHDLHTIELTVGSSFPGGGQQCRVVRITHDDAINAQGDGNTDPDWIFDDEYQLSNVLTVEVRSERSENDPVLPDRTYFAQFQCTDGTGTTALPPDVTPDPANPDGTDGWWVIVTVDDNQGGE